jgi:hypothetical protein
MQLKFRLFSGLLAVCQLPPNAPVPMWASGEGFVSVTRTEDELSIVCAAEHVPEGMKHEKGWICLQLQGPFPFQMTGVLASFLEPLAAHRIPIFAVSTYDTDYVLVKQEDVERALQALKTAGHEPVG